MYEHEFMYKTRPASWHTVTTLNPFPIEPFPNPLTMR